MRVITVFGTVFGTVCGSAWARPEPRFFASGAEIASRLLARRPRVLALGEYHQLASGPKVPSSVKRFADEMLATVAPAASDLTVETWVTEGRCGETETNTVAKVEKTIQRPETTEDELVTLLRRAKVDGIQPHILKLSCAEYADIQPKNGEIDYAKLLDVVTKQLQRTIEATLRRAPANRTVVVYGGALHNDVHPKRELARYSYASAIMKQVGGRYLEVDLYVPEYIAGDRELSREPWFVAWSRAQAAHPGQPALIERGPSSYIVIFPITTNAGASNPSPAPEQPQHG